MKPGLKDLHEFLTGEFAKAIRELYENFRILSEADLQAVAWSLLDGYLKTNDPTRKRFRVLNKPYLKDLRIHPDLVVFKRRNPWVIIELKERKKLTEKRARKDWDRLIRVRRVLCPKRAYLVYVARWGNGRALKGPKGPGAKFFFELPIVLQEVWRDDHVRKWEREFSVWSKYVAPREK